MKKAKQKLPSTAVGRRRLLKLADLLEADAKNKKGIKFDLGTWGKTERLAKFTKADCGTVGCAVGLACVSGVFKRAGLTFRIDDSGSIYPETPNPAHNPFNSWSYEPAMLTSYEAVQSFFNLTKGQTSWLFDADCYEVTKGAAGERAVANRIRNFVAGKATPTDLFAITSQDSREGVVP